jgi:hypothetical protein
MKIFLLLTTLLLSIGLFAQVGVGTTTPRGALEVNSTTSGLLPPRVVLTALNVASPVLNPQGGALIAGTLIWNTATAGVVPNNVVPGMYYWEGTRWISLAGSPGGLDWSLSGNTGTNPATNYVGTTDNVPLILRANSIERIRMGTVETVVNEAAQNYDFRVEGTAETEMFFVDASTNHVHVRASSPFPTIDMFTAVSPANDYPINGYTTGQGNAAVYGQHSTAATGTNVNIAGAFDAVGTGYSTQAGWNIGVVGTGNQAGVYGSSSTSSGNRQGGYFTSSNGTTTQSIASVAGFTTTGNDYYGGFFDGNQNTGDWAYVGIRIGGTNYKINGGGSVSTNVKDNNDKLRILFAPEAPEIVFQDWGTGKLSNGEAYINIDPVLTKNIFVDEKHPLKVFIQLEGDCNGVYVTEKTALGFKVKELQRGTSNTSFSWQIVANRADEFENGVLQSKHVDVRLPDGIGKLPHNKVETYSKTLKERKK